MKNVYIYCEGQTEEAFVNTILYPYFLGVDIIVYPIVCSTKRTPTRKYTGGVGSYKKIKSELERICKVHKHELVTTMFDYYAMPADTPNIDYYERDLYNRMATIEAAINSDIGMPNLKFHFMVHEFEGILFSNPESFGIISEEPIVAQIQKIRDEFETPEHINNSPETAPSKRLNGLISGYAKIKNGTMLCEDMGLDTIREQCVHFDNWIKEIIRLSGDAI